MRPGLTCCRVAVIPPCRGATAGSTSHHTRSLPSVYIDHPNGRAIVAVGNSLAAGCIRNGTRVLTIRPSLKSSEPLVLRPGICTTLVGLRRCRAPRVLHRTSPPQRHRLRRLLRRRHSLDRWRRRTLSKFQWQRLLISAVARNHDPVVLAMAFAACRRSSGDIHQVQQRAALLWR